MTLLSLAQASTDKLVKKIARNLDQAQAFCLCGTTCSASSPSCNSFHNFNAMLHESIEACNALDAVDCYYLRVNTKKCSSNLVDQFGLMDLSADGQCEYVDAGCGPGVTLPALRHWGCLDLDSMAPTAKAFAEGYMENCRAPPSPQPTAEPSRIPTSEPSPSPSVSPTTSSPSFSPSPVPTSPTPFPTTRMYHMTAQNMSKSASEDKMTITIVVLAATVGVLLGSWLVYCGRKHFCKPRHHAQGYLAPSEEEWFGRDPTPMMSSADGNCLSNGSTHMATPTALVVDDVELSTIKDGKLPTIKGGPVLAEATAIGITRS